MLVVVYPVTFVLLDESNFKLPISSMYIEEIWRFLEDFSSVFEEINIIFDLDLCLHWVSLVVDLMRHGICLYL
jgi:hypothetical protein